MGAPKPKVPRRCPEPLMELEQKSCVLFLNDQNEVVRLCPDDVLYPSDIVGISIEDYNCERNYQDELIRSCKKWK